MDLGIWTTGSVSQEGKLVSSDIIQHIPCLDTVPCLPDSVALPEIQSRIPVMGHLREVVDISTKTCLFVTLVVFVTCFTINFCGPLPVPLRAKTAGTVEPALFSF